MIAEEYRATAGAYDLFSEPFAAAQDAALRALLPHLDVTAGPVVDVGCGSGRHLAVVLHAVPGARVLGIEPSDAMRALAVARLAAEPAWRDRATVRPEHALAAPLPDRIAGAVLLGVIGHFDRRERLELFGRLARRTGPGCAVLFDLQPPESPADVPPAVFADTRLGDLRYRGIASASAIDDEAMRWRMTYQTLDGDAVIEERSTETVYRHPTPESLRGDLRKLGFRLQPLPDSTCWLAIREP